MEDQGGGAVHGVDVQALNAEASSLRSVDPERALALLNQAVTLEPADPILWHNRGLVLSSLGFGERAVADFSKALSFDPSLYASSLALASELLTLKRFKEALGPARRAVRLMPDAAAARAMLGLALLRAGRTEEAVEALEAAKSLDPADAHGASVLLASLGRGASERASDAYVEGLFDAFAPQFETALVRDLGYRGPEALREQLDRFAPGRRFARCLDLGCGSGLAGAALKARCASLVGVDISAGMLALAEAKGVYASLHRSELTAWLAGEGGGATAERFDLVTALDVFVYVGDLHRIFSLAASRLEPGGLLVFSVERAESGVEATEKRRFRHGRDHLLAAARASGLTELGVVDAPLRLEESGAAGGLMGIFMR